MEFVCGCRRWLSFSSHIDSPLSQKCWSKMVKNTLSRSGEIQLVIYEKYCTEMRATWFPRKLESLFLSVGDDSASLLSEREGRRPKSIFTIFANWPKSITMTISRIFVGDSYCSVVVVKIMMQNQKCFILSIDQWNFDVVYFSLIFKCKKSHFIKEGGNIFIFGLNGSLTKSLLLHFQRNLKNPLKICRKHHMLKIHHFVNKTLNFVKLMSRKDFFATTKSRINGNRVDGDMSAWKLITFLGEIENALLFDTPIYI